MSNTDLITLILYLVDLMSIHNSMIHFFAPLFLSFLLKSSFSGVLECRMPYFLALPFRTRSRLSEWCSFGSGFTPMFSSSSSLFFSPTRCPRPAYSASMSPLIALLSSLRAFASCCFYSRSCFSFSRCMRFCMSCISNFR